MAIQCDFISDFYPFLCSYDTSISIMLFSVVCTFLTMSTSLAILGQSVNVDVLEVLCRIGFKKVDSKDTGCVQSYFVYSPHTLILCSLLMSFRQRSWKVAIVFFFPASTCENEFGTKYKLSFTSTSSFFNALGAVFMLYK